MVDGDEIRSKVQRITVTIVMGDIRAAYDLVTPADALPDISAYEFDKQAFWEKVKTANAHAQVKTSFKKYHFHDRFTKAIDLIMKFIVSKAGGTNDVLEDMFKILHAIWTR